MQEIVLSHPYPNGSPDQIEPEGQAFLDALNEMEQMLIAGDPVYIKFLKGDRAGSIARFVPNLMVGDDHPNGRGKVHTIFGAEARKTRGFSHRDGPRFRYEGGAHGVAHWDGRRNKVKVFVPHGFAWLKGYYGPTVWEKFDAKAAKEARLANVREKDIDGEVLKVGDKVLYINSRYGSGSELCHGTIVRFEANRDTTWTIVKLDGADMESKIEYSGAYIWKKK